MAPRSPPPGDRSEGAASPRGRARREPAARHPTRRPERDEHPEVAQKRDALQVRETAVTLLRRRLVGGRCAAVHAATWRRGDGGRPPPRPTSVGSRSRPVQRREQEVTAPVAGEDPPGAIPAAASRSQPRGSGPRPPDRPSPGPAAPILLVREASNLLARPARATRRDAGGSARHDLVVHPRESCMLTRWLSRRSSRRSRRRSSGTSPSRPRDPVAEPVEQVTVVRDRDRGPVERLDRPSSTSMLSMSRWFVGSSSTRQFAPESISRQSSSRVRSPPESDLTGVRIWS